MDYFNDNLVKKVSRKNYRASLKQAILDRW